MKRRLSVRILEMSAALRLAMAACLGALLWLAVWWAL